MHITTRYCEVTAMDNVQARNLARGKIGTILLAVVKNFNCKKRSRDSSMVDISMSYPKAIM